jgi:hypothetical protein
VVNNLSVFFTVQGVKAADTRLRKNTYVWKNLIQFILLKSAQNLIQFPPLKSVQNFIQFPLLKSVQKLI